jgi:hypothetical protein
MWVNTTYYKAGLCWGFIDYLTVGGYIDLLNYSSWSGNDGEHFGLGLNEIQYECLGWWLAEPAVYTISTVGPELRVMAISSGFCGATIWNNTWYFSNSSATIECYDTRTIIGTSPADSRQICFIVPVGNIVNYFDATQTIASTNNWEVTSYNTSPYAGYTMKSALDMTVTILNSNPSINGGNASWEDSSIGKGRSDYNELQFTFYHGGDSGVTSEPFPNNATMVESAHYTISFSM